MKTVTGVSSFGGNAIRNYYPYGLPVNTSPQFWGYVTRTNSATYGDNIPNWRQVIASGGDATTYLLGEKYHVKVDRGSYYESASYKPGKVPQIGGANPGVYDEILDLFDPATSFPSTDPGSLSEVTALNLAKVRFAQKRQEVDQKFSGGVFLGELRETLHLIRSPAKALRSHIDSYFITLNKRVKRIRTGGVASRLRDAKRKVLADTWLEYAFGMRPLISDTRSAAEALASLAVGRKPHQRITATGVDERVTFNGSGLATIVTANWYRTGKSFSRCKVIIRGSVRADPSAHKLFSSTLWGFDPVQWIPTAWELVPYSFLVDYFTNVGDVLQSWASQSVVLEWANRTIIKEYRNILGEGGYFVDPPDHPDYVITCYGQVPRTETSRSKVERIAGYADFIPRFQFEIPGLSTKWINLAALLGTKRVSPFY